MVSSSPSLLWLPLLAHCSAACHAGEACDPGHLCKTMKQGSPQPEAEGEVDAVQQCSVAERLQHGLWPRGLMVHVEGAICRAYGTQALRYWTALG